MLVVNSLINCYRIYGVIVIENGDVLFIDRDVRKLRLLFVGRVRDLVGFGVNLFKDGFLSFCFFV